MKSLAPSACFAFLISSASAQLVLPYSGVDATATLSSFQIQKTGTTGRANTLYITNSANSSDVLLVNTVGGGRAGYFQLNNPNSTNQTLRADSNGQGASVFGFMTGTGRAGSFRIDNPSNTNSALFVQSNGTGPGLRVQAPSAAFFEGSVYASSTVTIWSSAPGSAPLIVNNPGMGSGLEVQGGYRGAMVWGQAFGIQVSSQDAVGGYGVLSSAFGVGGKGVSGVAHATTGVSYGAYFESKSTAGTGAVGYCPTATGITYGFKGNVASPDGFGVYSVGRFTATGTKSFQIDHPLNPENETLYHYCSEAPEPVNFYVGNTTTDSRGFATIPLPDYFEAINIDPKYTLTVIDSTDDFVFVKVVREVKDNQFIIRTSKPGVKVSWRVDATRNDRWVQHHGFKTTEVKPVEQRGKYVSPEAYGRPTSEGIHTPEPLPAEVIANRKG